MGLNDTPAANRLQIGIFGRRNAGKSSVINALTGQDLAIVSGVPGTTTDPVSKSMELLPLGPVVLTDTPGLDDEGELGEKRVRKSLQALRKTDLALLVLDASAGAGPEDLELLRRCREQGTPCVVAVNKSDTGADAPLGLPDGAVPLRVSARTGEGIGALMEALAAAVPQEEAKPLAGDLVAPGSFVVLVVPIDKAAPKGRLILPQQQVIRDLLDHGDVPVVCRDTELSGTLARLGTAPALVITDSQAFAQVSAVVPEEIPLTSFSILMARRSGVLESAVAGVRAADTLREGDRVLICEGCTHHRQCGDIGTVKLPRWLRGHAAGEPRFEFCSGTGFPDDLTPYRLIVHCGGCMLTAREIRWRLQSAREQGVPMTNYGILIAHMKGILRRSVQIFPGLAALLG